MSANDIEIRRLSQEDPADSVLYQSIRLEAFRANRICQKECRSELSSKYFGGLSEQERFVSADEQRRWQIEAGAFAAFMLITSSNLVGCSTESMTRARVRQQIPEARLTQLSAVAVPERVETAQD
jgi:hypothetical protein